jgi:hypothetical protein
MFRNDTQAPIILVLGEFFSLKYEMHAPLTAPLAESDDDVVSVLEVSWFGESAKEERKTC